MHKNVRALIAGILVTLLFCLSTSSALAQSPEVKTPAAQNLDSQIVSNQTAPSPEDLPAPPGHDPKATPAQKEEEAWSTLTTAVRDPKHPDLRVQALAALGTLGSNRRSLQLIATALGDHDLDVRTAAVLAAGQTGSRNLTTDLRTLLDDKEPQVAFIAAVTLWRMNDHSGEDILLAVINGQQSANAGMVSSTRHRVNKSLHHPGDLARLGAIQGISMFLGPFGIGVAAFEYMHKSGGDSPRANAIELISHEKTGPVRAVLVTSLADKDPTVRVAAAKALSSYHDPAISAALYSLLDDPKAPVRLTAAAAYINANTKPTRANPKK